MKMFKPGSEEQIVFIEYHHGLPFTIVTDGGNYDVEQCGGGEGGQIYCYNSGSGAFSGELMNVSRLTKPKPVISAVWVADGYGLKTWRRKGKGVEDVPLKTKQQVLALGYDWLDEPLDLTKYLDEYDRKHGKTTCNPFDIAEEIYEGFVYCRICECHMVDSNEDYCQHLFWSPVSSIVMGCGCAEIKYEDHKESFFKMLDKTQLANEIAKAICSGDYSYQYSGDIFGPDSIDYYLNGENYGSRFTDDLTEEMHDAMTDGVGWLNTLEPGKTKEAEKITLKWIREWLKLNSKTKTKQPIRTI